MCKFLEASLIAVLILSTIVMPVQSADEPPENIMQYPPASSELPSYTPSVQGLTETRFRHDAADKFNTSNWLEVNAPHLATCTTTLANSEFRLGEAIQTTAWETGINQRVLLALLEVETQVISNLNATCVEIAQIGPRFSELALEMAQNTMLYRFDRGGVETAEVSVYAIKRMASVPNDVSFAIADASAKIGMYTGEDPGIVEDRFYAVYEQYFGDPTTDVDVSSDPIIGLDAVTFYLPFMGDKGYTSGPHGGGTIAGCAHVATSATSGIDFDNGDTAVLAIATGTIVGIRTDTSSPGKWVAIEHANGIVSMYWHLASINSNLLTRYQNGETITVSRGAYLGEEGNTGCAGCGAHTHLELRTAGANYRAGAIGLPVSWNGRIIDNWWIWSEIYLDGTAANYNGTAIDANRVNASYAKTISTNCGSVTASVEPGFSGNTEVSTEITKFAMDNGSSKLDSTNAGYCPAATPWQTSNETVNDMCGEPNPPSDTTPPSASAFWGEVSGGMAHIYTNGVQDNPGGSGIKEVRFSAAWGGQWRGIGTDSSSPYSLDWDMCSSGVPDTSDIELGMEVWDNSGNKWVWSQHFTNPHINKNYTCSSGGGEPISGSPWNTHAWMNKYMAGYTNWEGTFTWSNGYPYIWLDWDDGAPFDGWSGDEFSMRLWRQVWFPGGNYDFHVDHDDGAKVYVDGNLVIDAWWDCDCGHDGGRNLTQGWHEVKVEYYENHGGAELQVQWYGNGYPRPDLNSPSGRIISPANQSALSAQNLLISAEASDDVSGVRRVEFYACYGQPSCSWYNIGNVTSAPFSLNWDWNLLSDQLVVIAMDVYDWAGRVTYDAGGLIYVYKDRGSPQVNITYPVGETRYDPGIITVRANSWDAVSGLSGIQFYAGYVDGINDYWHDIGWDSNGNDGWSVSWNSNVVPLGTQVSFFVYAYDKANNYAGDVVWNNRFDVNIPYYIPLVRR